MCVCVRACLCVRVRACFCVCTFVRGNSNPVWFVCVVCRIHICGTWLICMCHVTHPHVCQDSLMIYDITHSYVGHDSFICVPWIIHMCDTGNIDHNSFVCGTWLLYMCHMCDTGMCHMCDTGTGWRRLIGCLKLQVHSAKEPLIIGLFCGKRPMKIKHPMILHNPVTLIITIHMWDMTHSYVFTWLIHMCNMTHS